MSGTFRTISTRDGLHDRYGTLGNPNDLHRCDGIVRAHQLRERNKENHSCERRIKRLVRHTGMPDSEGCSGIRFAEFGCRRPSQRRLQRHYNLRWSNAALREACSLEANLHDRLRAIVRVAHVGELCTRRWISLQRRA